MPRRRMRKTVRNAKSSQRDGSDLIGGRNTAQDTLSVRTKPLKSAAEKPYKKSLFYFTDPIGFPKQAQRLGKTLDASKYVRWNHSRVEQHHTLQPH